MPARSTWRGSIQISGLSIAVRVFNAVDRSPDIELHQYHKCCANRIQFKRVCPVHGTINSDEIVDGVEYAPDQIILLTADESQSILPEDTKTVVVEYFVSKDEYEKVCLSGKHFYIVPDHSSDQRPFAAIHEALTTTNQVGLATIVLYQSEYVVGIKPIGRLLQLSVIEYPDRVREVKDYESEVERVSISREESTLASELIRSMSRPSINLDDKRNPRTMRLSRLLEERIKHDLDHTARQSSPEDNSLPDSNSALICALRNAISSTNRGQPSKATAAKSQTENRKLTG